MAQAVVSPQELLEAVETFLGTCQDPVFLEEGAAPMGLYPGNHAIELHAGRLTILVWDAGRSVQRRVLGITARRPGRLDLEIQRFGARPGTVTLFDAARARNRTTELRGGRRTFREQFRRFLRRQFTGWSVVELTTEPDLQNSLSPQYSRAFLRKGQEAWAAMGVPEDSDADGSLTFGLIWLDYLRRREQKVTVHGLVFYLPDGAGNGLCLRARWLNPDALQMRLFAYGEDGEEQAIDPADVGNLETHLEPANAPTMQLTPELAAWTSRLARLEGVERVRRADGEWSLRVRGLEFAATRQGRLVFGLDHRTVATAADVPEMERLAVELARLRSAHPPDPANPLYTRNPELWLESQVRAQLTDVHAALVPGVVYGQVPSFAGGDRGVIDLLAVEHTGRLTVMEVKASEDVHLPLQALDYWMRVKVHLEREDFSRLGYFSGICLTKEWPRLLLIGPSLDFHPANETVLRYFSPAIPVERIGVAVKWEKELQVMFRLPGAGSPEATPCPWQTTSSKSGRRSNT